MIPLRQDRNRKQKQTKHNQTKKEKPKTNTICAYEYTLKLTQHYSPNERTSIAQGALGLQHNLFNTQSPTNLVTHIDP